jgi:hypothetical protein
MLDMLTLKISERWVLDMEVYNKNRDNNNSMYDEIREQNAKLKGAPLNEKWAYFKEYYLKMTLAIIAAAIFIIYLAYTMITAPRDTAFAAYFFNDTGDSSNTELADSFAEYMNIDTKKAECYIDATLNYSPDGADYDSYIGLEKVMAVISSKELDVIVGDADTVSYFAKSECFSNVTEILPEDLLEKFKDDLFYAPVGESEELVPVGIYITGAPKIDEYYYYVGMEPIMGFVVNSNSIDNAIEFLRYIYK